MNGHDLIGWLVVVLCVLATCLTDSSVAWMLRKLDAWIKRRRRKQTPAQHQRQHFYWHSLNAFDALNRRNGERGLQ